MKKTISKLTLGRETIRVLAGQGLTEVRGGLRTMHFCLPDDTEPPNTFVDCANSVDICGTSFGNCNITFNFNCVPP